MSNDEPLARRTIPLRERAQKALIAFVITILLTVWLVIEEDKNPAFSSYIWITIVCSVLVGFGTSAYFWLKKEQVAKSPEDNYRIRQLAKYDKRGVGWLLRLVSRAIVIVGGLVAIAGVGILGMQIYTVFKSGSWPSMSLLTTLTGIFPWLDNPQSWIGLHRIIHWFLDMMPLSLAVFLLGILVAGFGSGLIDRQS